ncbi:MAG: M23 family metallopeptidase [Candidatus Xenobiia bacterium LiM19]
MKHRHICSIIIAAMLLSITFTCADAQNPGQNLPSLFPTELNKILKQGIPTNINTGEMQKVVNVLNGKSPADLINGKVPAQILNGKSPADLINGKAAEILNGKSPAEVLNTRLPSELMKLPGIKGADSLKSAMDRYANGDKSGAMSLFEQLISQLSAGGNKAKLTDTLQQIGNYLSQNGDKANALQYLSKAIDAGITGSDTNRLQNILKDCEPLFIWQETEDKSGSGSSAVPANIFFPPATDSTLPGNSIHSTNTIAIPKVPSVDVIKAIPIPRAPQSSTSSANSEPSQTQEKREKNTIAIPKCNEPAASKAIEIPKCQDVKVAKTVEIPSTGEKKSTASAADKKNKKAADVSAQKQNVKEQKPAAQLRYTDDGTLLIARSESQGGVLSCAGPAARNLSYENLFVKKEWSRYHLNPVPGGRYAPYAADMGLDIAADRGYPVFSTMDGVVLYNSPSGHCIQRGPYDDQGAIRIRHSNGSDTFYAHLSGRNAALKPGTKIRQGEWLGNVGTANRVPHLHLSIFYGYTRYENPFTTARILLNPWKAVAFAQ